MFKYEIKINDCVLVSDPKHDDSIHEHSFQGVVVEIKNNMVTIQDCDGDCFDCEFDEILEII